MTRRRKVAAIAIVATLLVTVGIGAHRSGGSRGSVCEEQLDDLIWGCANAAAGCGEVPDEFKDACETACLTGMCPKEAAYLMQDPIWDLPCSDMRGARFWKNFDDGNIHCQNKLHFGHPEFDPAVHLACWDAEVQ